jgi:ATP-dependent DNA ligase
MAQFPTLFGEATTGKIKQWSIQVFEQNHCGVIQTEHGYQDGKKQTTQKTISCGKNIGKKNETTALEQAISEARACWIKKKESGYSEIATPLAIKNDDEDDDEKMESPSGGRGKGIDPDVPSVMLAHDYNKRGKNIQFPCNIQRKFDGTRCVAVPGKGLFSRNKKAYPHLEHIVAEINRLPPNMILDGELYSTTLTFQEIVGLVKRETLKSGDQEKQLQIKFFVYDLINQNPYDNRYINLQILFRKYRFKHLVLVHTESCQDEDAMKQKHAEYVLEGYEGIMLRNKQGLYKGSRSTDLQKYKEFFDAEYEVIGYEEGQGLDEGCVVWTCKTKSGKSFSCRPRGTREDRQAMFLHGDDYIGQMLTVRYQELTDEGLPRFPVGITFRNYE